MRGVEHFVFFGPRYTFNQTITFSIPFANAFKKALVKINYLGLPTEGLLSVLVLSFDIFHIKLSVLIGKPNKRHTETKFKPTL